MLSHGTFIMFRCTPNASKAFNMVDHGVLFCMLIDNIEVYHCLFLGSCCLGMLHMYSKSMCVVDLDFLTSNGVWQGIVPSHQFRLLCI